MIEILNEDCMAVMARYPDNHFDYIVCHCVWMYTDREKSLREMIRVLKPGGKIYLGAIADLGWYPKLIWQALKKGDRRLFVESLRAMARGVQISEKTARNLMGKIGLKTFKIGFDSQLGRSEIKVKPIYERSFFGMRIVYEILAEKPMQHTK